MPDDGNDIWKPILGSDRSYSALTLAEVLLDELKSRYDPRDHSARSMGVSLTSGLGGVALLEGYVRQATGCQPDWTYVEAIADRLRRVPMSPWLSDGFSGVAWLVTHLLKLTGQTVDRGTVGRIDDALIRFLQRPRPVAEHELLQGVVGLGVYALEAFPSEPSVAMLDLVLRQLRGLAVRTKHGTTWMTSHGQSDEVMKRIGVPYSVVGLAHGTGGVVAFLAALRHRVGDMPLAAELLEEGSAWLEASALSPVGEVAAEAETSPLYPTLIGPKGTWLSERWPKWCNGDLGICVALIAAGRAMRNTAMAAIATERARWTLSRARSQTVPDLALCHGVAGLLQISAHLYNATGERQFKDEAEHWLDVLMASRRRRYRLAGYPEWTTSGQYRFRRAGLLNGAAGIGLAIMSAPQSARPAWDSVMLLSGGIT